ncbi:MAG: hypothetical protein PVG38_11985 [Gammaproteobacteria bacterium]|jgi:hypothetical protein
MTTLSSPAAPERGAVLITSLIFLVMLTVAAVVANQSTVLETRMSTNAVVKARAVEGSEALRMASHELLDTHLYYRGWPQALGGNLNDTLFDIPPDLALDTPLTNWGTTNGAAEDLFDPATWIRDMTLRFDGNGDGDLVDDVDQQADFYAYKTVVVNATGSATAMVAGYEGLGKSSASGGALMFFDLRSAGMSAANSSGVTGSNYRYVVRN